MPDYRFYEINQDGHIAGPPKIQHCRDDETALKEVERFLNGKNIESGAVLKKSRSSVTN